MDILTLEKIKSQLEPKEMAGLILVEFEKNKYCATQISTVLGLLLKAYHQYKDIQPIEFSDSSGECELIQLYKERVKKKNL